MITAEERKLDMMRHLGLAPPAEPIKRAPKKRTRQLPPARAACDTLMDGDRLAAHVSQCLACHTAGAVLQVSNDGATWTNYTGTVEGVESYRHVRCIATTPKSEPGRTETDHVCGNGCAVCDPPAAKAKPKCAACADASAPLLMRWENIGGVGIVQRLTCARCYLDGEHNVARSTPSTGKPYAGPERFQSPPLAHSYGIEDPALPDV